ncbi:hypothetical protein U9M48_031175 [Paspalum notatum var. saurae]|uniref:Knottins-like domain-containing protein n=1 Tax=Paspalum notatum var. saurae TaxID=547442 RepID=A0AAQ3U2N7_PASNO
MEPSRKFLPAVVLLLLLVATDIALVHARECDKDSTKYVGPCINRENCANVCRGEGFSSGRCSTFRRRCVCSKQC